MTEPIPVQPRPDREEEQAKLQYCWWHSRPCPTAKVREPQGQPICWYGWVALLHATGTCGGECHYETETKDYPTDMEVRTCPQDR